MWSRLLFLFALLYPSVAHAADGKFSLVPKNGVVKFDATCFDDEAMAKILTFSEFIAVELNAACSFEKDKMLLDHRLEVENLQIEKEGLKERYAIEINTRDEEIETLRDIIKKNKKLNIPVVIATSVAIGFGVGFGTYHLASR
jgi:hypothetical protein